MSEITVGSVSVDVVPDARQFPSRLARQINPEAARIGQEFGRLFGASAERQMSEGVRDGLSSGSRQSTSQGSKAGEDYGGAFARTLKARLEAAFRSLPDVQIDADSSAADREIAALRGQIEELRDKRIGIDVDAATARATVDRLSEQLRLLSQQSPDVQVRVEAGAASAELRRFGVEVDRLDGQTAHIDVDVDTAGASAQLALMRGQALGAQTGMVGLIGAALLLGPALIPIGAAAVGAFGAIVTGALAAAGGIGVLVLALAPVIAAVQAVRAAHDQSAQSARGSTSAHLQMAAAMDGVANAQRSLASAQEDARVAQARSARAVQDAERKVADAERTSARNRIDDARKVADSKRQLTDAIRQAADDQEAAARRVEDAERSVADAQRDATDAQRALSDARKQAAREAEDLAAQVAGGVLDERDAVLRVEEAQQRLAETMSDPQASDLQRQRAQLAVDEAVQGLADQRRENARLAEEKAAADAAGIEGSRQVQDAQDRVADSQQRLVDARRAASDAAQAQARAEADSARAVAEAQRDVADAERDAARRRADDAQRVADAQRGVSDAVAASAEQQRQSAESIVSAQQAVVAAQRGVQQASQSAGASGGAAMDKVRDKMAALTPEGRRFVGFLTDEFLPLFSGLSDVAQRNLLPGLQSGLAALEPLMPVLTTLVAGFSRAMGGLFESAGEALGAPFWRDFFGYVADVGPDLLEQIGGIIGDLVTGFAGLTQAFDPVTQGFFDGLGRIAEAFSEFGQNASQSSGFQSFIAYIQQVGPQVVSTFGAIATAVGHILEALAPLGPVVLTVVTGFANLISALPAPVLAGIVVGVGALAVAIGLLNAGLAITAALLAANPVVLIIGGIVVAIAALVAAFYILYERNDEFRTRVQAVWAAVSGFISSAWTGVIQPVLSAIWSFIRDTLIPAFVAFLVPAVRVAWATIGVIIDAAWTVIRTTLRAVKAFVENVLAPVFSWLWREVISPAWTGIQVLIAVQWGLIRLIFGAIKLYVEGILAPVFTWLWHNVIEPAWDGIYSAVKTVWNTFLKPLFETIGDFISDVVAPAFATGVEAIGRAWDGIKAAAKAPVKFVVDTVINKGIIGAFNKVAGVFKVDGIDPVQLPEGFASGGYISGPGGPREDKIPAMLSNGEYVIQARIVQRLGKSFFDYLNGGGSIGGDPGGIARFADGGLAKRIDDTVRWLPSVDPLPYVWGAVGPNSFDCSGLVGEVWARVTDHARNTRYFTTSANMSSFGFSPGEGVYTIGVRPGQHMAGRLAGLPFEAASTASGIHVGARAQSVTNFPNVYHLSALPGGDGGGIDWVNPISSVKDLFSGALGKLDSVIDSPWGRMVTAMPRAIVSGAKDFLADAVNPFADGGFVGEYDQGGYLPPGLSTVINKTGSPEPVFNPQQWELLRRQTGQGGGQPVMVTQNITNPAPETAGDSLAAGMRRLALYGLVGQR